MDSRIISLNLNCILQLKQIYNIATKVSCRKKCYYFWWSTWLLIGPQKIEAGIYIYANLLWPSDAIWRHRSGSTLAQVTACYWRHQAITRTNLDLSSKLFYGIHLRAISQEALMDISCNKHFYSAPYITWANSSLSAQRWLQRITSRALLESDHQYLHKTYILHHISVLLLID